MQKKAKLEIFTFNNFAENTYIIYQENGEAAIVDPGNYEENENKQIACFIDINNLKVTTVVNTHCHIDHVLGNAWVKATYGITLGIHNADQETLQSVSVYAPNYGFPNYTATTADYFIEANQDILLAGHIFKVLFVPGHAPGHIAFYNAEDGYIVSGDVLFRQSVGRTDLPGGDFELLKQSIIDKLYTLPESTIIYPGHGPSTTIGYEKMHNPYVKI